MIFMTFISMHSVIMCIVLPWRTYEMHPDLFLKSGCDNSRHRKSIRDSKAVEGDFGHYCGRLPLKTRTVHSTKALHCT
jgi:hypothetical protein